MKNNRNNEDLDPKLLAILSQKDQPLDGAAFMSQLMAKVDAEEIVTIEEARTSWLKPTALGSAAVAALAIAAPSLTDVGVALVRFTPDTYLDLGRLLGISVVAAGALLTGLAPVANSLGEAMARGSRGRG